MGALERAYRVLGFEDAVDRDEVFRHLVLARITSTPSRAPTDLRTRMAQLRAVGTSMHGVQRSPRFGRLRLAIQPTRYAILQALSRSRN